MPRRKPDPRTWTPNQIVSFNINQARLKRGWTQDQAAEALAPYLGTRLSTASWSAIERSVDGGRIREFTADEIIAFARGFELPLGWFLTPPPASDDIRVATPDTKNKGLDPRRLLDVVLGNSRLAVRVGRRLADMAVDDASRSRRTGWQDGNARTRG